MSDSRGSSYAVGVKPLDVLLILVCLMFATGVIVDQRWGPEREQHEQIVRFQQRRLDVIKMRLKEHEEKTGRYPTMVEGLEVVPGLRGALMSGRFGSARAFLEQSDGIRTIHGIPYVYENRDLQPEAFADSPANQDTLRRRRWSRKVAPGIFVSSLGLRADVSRVFGRQWLDALIYFGGGVIVFLAVAYIIARNRRSSDRVRGINAMVVVGVAGLLGIIVFVSSGPEIAQRIGGDRFAEPLGSHRSDMLIEYLAVMRSVVDKGGMDAVSFNQLEESLFDEFGIPRTGEQDEQDEQDESES